MKLTTHNDIRPNLTDIYLIYNKMYRLVSIGYFISCDGDPILIYRELISTWLPSVGSIRYGECEDLELNEHDYVYLLTKDEALLAVAETI